MRRHCKDKLDILLQMRFSSGDNVAGNKSSTRVKSERSRRTNRRHFLKLTALAGAAYACGRPGAWAGPARSSVLNLSSAARTLGEHRIVKMEQRRLRDQFGRTVGANSRGRVVGTGGAYQVRRIITDKGAAGWAMSHWKPDQVKQFIGARVGDLYDVEQGAAVEAMKLDRVLDDLAGNILGMPVYKMFGAKGPASVPLYSGAIYLDDLLPEDKPRGIDGVLQSCRQDYEAGYRAFKLKIGRGFKRMPRKPGLKRDIDVTRAVRRNFPKCRVLVDANDAYTVEEACTYVAAVADCDLYWIEEPFEENRDGLLKLHEVMNKVGCKALIAEGEGRKAQADPLTAYGGYTSEFTDRLYNLAAERLVDVFLFDLGIVGFTRWRHIMPALVEAGVKASPHTWMWLPRPYYAAQLAAGVGNIPIVEGIPGTTKGIDTSAYELRNGELVVPETPGFGLKLS